jgi:hypothetical protein
MKKVMATATGFIFGAFGIAILGLLMSLTYQALGRIFPESPENQIWGLVLFDIAAMVWAGAFVFKCETTAQYAVAFIGFLTGFLGTMLMVAAEVMLGQQLTQVQSQEVGKWMVYGFIGATLLHAGLLYLHHYSGKAIRIKVDVGIAQGEVVTEAVRQATADLERDKRDLARDIATDIRAGVLRELNIYPAAGTIFEPKQATADVPAILPSPISDADKAMYAPGTRFTDGTSNPEPTYHPIDLTPQPQKEAGSQPNPFLKSEPDSEKPKTT